MVRNPGSGLTPRANPFIPEDVAPPPPEVLEKDPLWNGAMSLKGPRSPESAPPVDVTQVAPWPIVEITRRPLVCVVGLHGGSGETLLRGLLGDDSLETGRLWPVFTGWDRPAPSLPVVATARTNYEGIAAATRFAKLWAANTLPSSSLLGVVLLDDGPRLSTQQKAAVRRVAQMTPNGWHLPWNETWRLSQPSIDAASVRVRRIIQNIRTLAENTNGEHS